MKSLRNVSIILLIAMLISCFAACNASDEVQGGEEETTTVPSFEAPTEEPDDDDDGTNDDSDVTTDDNNGGNTGDDDYIDHEVWTDYNIISIEKALEICAGLSAETTERYYVCGFIKSITNAAYGAMVITDGTNEIAVYNTKNSDGTIEFPSIAEKPSKGAEVLLYCTLQNYNGTKEIKSAYLIDFIPAEININEADYTPATIADARNAQIGAKLSVTGVVAAITYANGQIPSGVYVVDGTQSIYVYSSDIAQSVSVGNTVKILGTRDNWILDSEISNAEKFGYVGCCQLTDAYLVSNDNGNTAFDKSWITETTVKDIMDTPVTENITTTIYKVTALIKKTPAQGFVNYYIDDLDGKTGSYAYTQCNGSDFAWLDKFDGKICTVYLSVINAKATGTDCIWRFLPVLVEDNNYQFDTTKAPEFVVKYHGVDQFVSSYTGDPALELITSIDSELLGFSGATLSYESSNTDVINFVVENGKTVMHCTGSGTVTVTITGSYNGTTYSETIEIINKNPDDIEYGSVKEAIDSAIGDEVIIKGIVAAGTTNQNGGFFIIDETGSIPVICLTDDELAGVQLGNEVIIRGIRDVTKYGAGQIRIKDAVIVANLYGNHAYSTDSFIKNATMEDIKALADTPESTTNVYVVTTTVAKTSSTQGSYTNVTFNVGGVQLYSSGATQYSWLEAFFAEGQTEATLTVELAICDWNAKGLKGCVISVITDDGKVCNPYNFS